MPQREYVPGRVHVAVVSDTALTGPCSYSETRSPFRAVGAQRAATRTSLGGVPFIDFDENAACVLALIGQQRFQCEPTGVEHRLGHVCFHQTGTGDVPDNDQAVFIDQLPTEFMQRIVAPVPNLGVDRPHPGFLPSPLSDGQFPFLISIEATRFQRIAF